MRMNMSIKKSLVRIDQLETNSSSVFGKNVTNGPILFFTSGCVYPSESDRNAVLALPEFSLKMDS